MNIHLEFAVTPTPGPGWGEIDMVHISIPKRKFKTVKDVYKVWYKRTGNIAKKITMIKEKIIL
tara:strand:+ start:54 stop:242 length:189 start_codon:yes stop_codon:yes gene_type:complete